MLLSNKVPFKGEAPVTATDTFVHHGHIQHTSLLHQPHNSSMYADFTANEMPFWQVLLRGKKRWKSLRAKSGLYSAWYTASHLKFCSKFQVHCTMYSQALLWRRIMPLPRIPGCFFLMASHKLYSIAQYLLALTVCPRSWMSTSNTLNMSQKTVTSTFPADGVTLQTLSSWVNQGVSAPRLITYWREWNDGSSELRLAISLVDLLLLVNTHSTMWHGPYSTETHLPRYAVQRCRTNHDHTTYAVRLHICLPERVPQHVQHWLLSLISFVTSLSSITLSLQDTICSTFGNLLPRHDISAIHFHELLMDIGCQHILCPQSVRILGLPIKSSLQ
jgi:hypothetical protein